MTIRDTSTKQPQAPGLGHETTLFRLATSMLRPALMATTVVGLAALAVATLVGGGPAAAGSVFGTALVIASGWVTIALMRWTVIASPVVVMTVAVGGYCAKFVVLLILLLLVRSWAVLDSVALGLTILATVSVWTLAELIGFVRAEVYTVTPSDRDSG